MVKSRDAWCADMPNAAASEFRLAAGDSVNMNISWTTRRSSVGENRATGEKSPTVRLIDFDRVENNRFMAVCQFKVRVLGTEHHIVPDVVLFVNGIQVVVIEAKSPKVKDALSVIDYVIVHELAHLLEEET